MSAGATTLLVRFSLALFAVVSVACMVAVLCRVLADPCNHVGPDPRYLWLLYAVTLIAGVVRCAITGHFSGLGALLVVVGGIGLLQGLVIDWCNILISYSQWGDRGMPNRWGPSLHQ